MLNQINAGVESGAVVQDQGGGLCLTGLAELPDNSYLDDKALGAALDVSARTIRRMTTRHELPPPVRLAGRSLWIAGKVRVWIADRAEQAAKDAEKNLVQFRKNLS
jgi:predicted DNA-binding transcriptional regulator AlpA